jgi:hypothetical protein
MIPSIAIVLDFCWNFYSYNVYRRQALCIESLEEE